MTKKSATATKLAATTKSAKTAAPPDTSGVYLTTPEAAFYIKLSRQYLEGARYRADDSGPPYIKLERAVRYRKSALDTWMAKHDHAPDKPL
jgi:predicted DNA-binding transcriptional regulator AlpA